MPDQTAATAAAARESRIGLIAGVGAFTLWGLYPFYFKALASIPALEIVAHRIVWSVALLACALPFASPSALVSVQSAPGGDRSLLAVAQDQHRCVLAAIERREGARAEAIMREHARIAHRNLERALANQAMHLVPGAALIRRRLGR